MHSVSKVVENKSTKLNGRIALRSCVGEGQFELKAVNASNCSSRSCNRSSSMSISSSSNSRSIRLNIISSRCRSSNVQVIKKIVASGVVEAELVVAVEVHVVL